MALDLILVMQCSLQIEEDNMYMYKLRKVHIKPKIVTV